MTTPTTFRELRRLADAEGRSAMYTRGEEIGHPCYSRTGPLGLSTWTCPVCKDVLKPDGSRGIAFQPCQCLRKAYLDAKFSVYDTHRPGVVGSELANAGVPDRYLGATFGTFRPRSGTEGALPACQDYASTFEPGTSKGFCLQGPTGSGKTHLSAATLRAILEEHDLSPVFVEAVHYLNATLTRKYGNTDPTQRYLEAPLLVLDDLGNHRINEATTDEIYRLIAARYGAKLSTIVTTNFAYDDNEQSFQRAFGPGFRSRMVEMCPAVVCNATDYREEGRL